MNVIISYHSFLFFNPLHRKLDEEKTSLEYQSLSQQNGSCFSTLYQGDAAGDGSSAAGSFMMEHYKKFTIEGLYENVTDFKHFEDVQVVQNLSFLCPLINSTLSLAWCRPTNWYTSLYTVLIHHQPIL
jgi:hypothetical protein